MSSEKNACYTWADLTIRVTEAPAVIEEAMEKMFGLCRTMGHDGDVDVRMILRENDDFIETMPLSIRKRYETMPEDADPVIEFYPDGEFAVLSKSGTTGAYAVCAPPFTEADIYSQVLAHQASPLLFNSVLIPVIRELLLRRGKALLHAGCVATSAGDGVIIIADSGGGKTTTTIALAREGFRVVSDDLIALSKSEQGIRVEGIRKPVNISRRTIDFFPELSYLGLTLRWSAESKTPVDPIKLFGPEGMAQASRASTILIPQVKRDGPGLELMNIGDVLTLLLKSHTFAAGGPVAKESLDILWPLLEGVRTFRLATGYKPRRLGQWMAKESSRGRFGNPCTLHPVKRDCGVPSPVARPTRTKKRRFSQLKSVQFRELTRRMLNCTLDGEDRGDTDALLTTEPILLAAWKMARHHRIEAHMAKWLREASDAPESTELIDPEEVITRAMVFSMSLQSAAKRIFDRISRVGIRAIMLRGPALAVRYFPEAHLRHSRDVDIICRRQDLPGAEAELLGLGYRPIGNREYWEKKGEWPFSDGKHTVELHWDAYPVMQTHVPRPRALVEFRDDLETAKIDGADIPCLGLNHLVLSSCLHASWEHKLDRLVRLIDLRQIAKLDSKRIDWEWIVRQTIDTGNALAVRQALRCAVELVDAPVPEEVMEELRPVGLRKRLGEVSLPPLECIGSRGVAPKIRRALFHLALK